MARDPDHWKRIAAIGGRNGKGENYKGGFAADIECDCGDIPGVHYVRECAGKRGGFISRRKPVKKAVDA